MYKCYAFLGLQAFARVSAETRCTASSCSGRFYRISSDRGPDQTSNCSGRFCRISLDQGPGQKSSFSGRFCRISLDRGPGQTSCRSERFRRISLDQGPGQTSSCSGRFCRISLHRGPGQTSCRSERFRRISQKICLGSSLQFKNSPPRGFSNGSGILRLEDSLNNWRDNTIFTFWPHGLKHLTHCLTLDYLKLFSWAGS